MLECHHFWQIFWNVSRFPVLKMARHMICFMLRDPGKYSAVIIIDFYGRKDRISFSVFVSSWLVVPSSFTTNLRATILYIWTWIGLFWNILVKVIRIKCAAFNSRIFMCMSDSSLLHGPPPAPPCIMLPISFLMYLFEKLVVPNDVLLLCYFISPGCLLTVSALPQNLNSDALKFGRSISTLIPVFVVPEDTHLEIKLVALPLLLNIGFLLDLLFSRESQIHSGESPGIILWNPELFPVLK